MPEEEFMGSPRRELTQLAVRTDLVLTLENAGKGNHKKRDSEPKGFIVAQGPENRDMHLRKAWDLRGPNLALRGV